MRIFITRAAQTLDKTKGSLSPLGSEQARLLGERLRADGFSGIIYSSPLVWAMETAEIIAGIVGSQVLPVTAFSAPAADGSESYEDVRYRVALAMGDIMKSEEDDLLLVGHNESADAMGVYFSGEPDGTPLFSASYTLYDTLTKRFVRNNTLHLTVDKMTYNDVPYFENRQEIKLPEGLLSDSGFRVLHIGDTPSYSYDWNLSLVKLVKPDVIIHTGDTADEMKVSRDLSVRDAYFDRAGAFLRALCANCKRVIWVPGNNDLPDRLPAYAPDVEYMEQGTVIDIEGVTFALAHEKNHLTEGADVHLYGHSTRFELWSPQRNTPDRECYYLNASWHASVVSLPSKKLYTVQFPYET